MAIYVTCPECNGRGVVPEGSRSGVLIGMLFAATLSSVFWGTAMFLLAKVLYSP